MMIIICSTEHTIAAANNATNVTLMGDDYTPGRFLPHSLCFGDISQQETYYIIPVSLCAQDFTSMHACIESMMWNFKTIVSGSIPQQDFWIYITIYNFFNNCMYILVL